MVTFYNILANPLIGLSPLAPASVALGEADAQLLHVFRTGIDCSPAGAAMIGLERAVLAKDPDASRFINDVADGLNGLQANHPKEYKTAMGYVARFCKERNGDPKALQQFGEPRDIFFKMSEGERATPIRFRSVTPKVAVEEGLFFLVEGGLEAFRLSGPDDRGLVDFRLAQMEEGSVLYIGKQESGEPIQITSRTPKGVPLGLQLRLKGANGRGPYFAVESGGRERPKIDRYDGLPDVGQDEVRLTLHDFLHIGDGYRLRLILVPQIFSAKQTRIGVPAVIEAEPPAPANGTPLGRIAIRRDPYAPPPPILLAAHPPREGDRVPARTRTITPAPPPAALQRRAMTPWQWISTAVIPAWFVRFREWMRRRLNV